MSKRALIVGCNYPGTKSALNGCINDAHSIRDVLINCKGFPAENVRVMTDAPDCEPKPTGENIRKALAEMVGGAKKGDSLVFHYSGHGTQVPSGDKDEHDKKDEAICPTDLNLIIDDDLCQILSKLADGVDFLMISDCCHSGSLLDHNVVQITGDKGGKRQKVKGPSLLDLIGGRELDTGDMRNRSLPVNDLCAMLTERSGIPTTPDTIRRTLGSMFGEKAGAFVKKFVSNYAGEKIGEKAGNVVRSFLQGEKISLSSVFGGSKPQATPQDGSQPAAQQGQGSAKLPEDTGILITGCCDFETSADATPGGDKSKSFGALTNALTTIVKSNPDINYYDLVTAIREELKKAGFTQNPCLECSQNNAKKVFAA